MHFFFSFVRSQNQVDLELFGRLKGGFDRSDFPATIADENRRDDGTVVYLSQPDEQGRRHLRGAGATGRRRSPSLLAGFHSLRRAFNTDLANSSVSQEIRQRRIGHASEEITHFLGAIAVKKHLLRRRRKRCSVTDCPRRALPPAGFRSGDRPPHSPPPGCCPAGSYPRRCPAASPRNRYR